MRNLKEYPNYLIGGDGVVKKEGKVIKPFTKSNNYICVNLRNNSNVVKKPYVHRLVGMLYVDGYSPELDINHIDGDKSNNNYTNLEWCTRSQNVRHAIDTGLWAKYQTRHEKHEKVAHEILTLLQDGLRTKDIVRQGYERATITNIKRGKTYEDLAKHYDLTSMKREVRSSLKNVQRICEMLQEGIKPMSIVEELGCNKETVYNIRRRNTFTSVSSKYTW